MCIWTFGLIVELDEEIDPNAQFLLVTLVTEVSPHLALPVPLETLSGSISSPLGLFFLFFFHSLPPSEYAHLAS